MACPASGPEAAARPAAGADGRWRPSAHRPGGDERPWGPGLPSAASPAAGPTPGTGPPEPRPRRLTSCSDSGTCAGTMGRFTPRCSFSFSPPFSFPFSASPFSAWVIAAAAPRASSSGAAQHQPELKAPAQAQSPAGCPQSRWPPGRRRRIPGNGRAEPPAGDGLARVGGLSKQMVLGLVLAVPCPQYPLLCFVLSAYHGQPYQHLILSSHPPLLANGFPDTRHGFSYFTGPAQSSQMLGFSVAGPPLYTLLR